MLYVYVNVCHIHAGAHRGQRRLSEALELDLQPVGQPVGDLSNLGIGNWSLGPLEEQETL